jgi:hypothetical protein
MSEEREKTMPGHRLGEKVPMSEGGIEAGYRNLFLVIPVSKVIPSDVL